MRRSIVPLLAIGLLTPLAFTDEPAPLRGYTADSARVQRDWEAKFRAIPEPANIREYDQHLSARPHHVGSPYDKENAEWMLAKFKSWGLDSHIETFDVLYPTPKERLLEMVAPTHFKAKLLEPAVAVDPTTGQREEQLPTTNVYSIDGDVTAPLVYVNFGVPDDYDQLARLGVSVKGAIVISRYGGSWRGIKPKVAAEHGAVGCLIYSDPHEDGYFRGDSYPNGPTRPPDGAQRGSVMDMPLHPGDPLTPGWGATKDAKRLPIKDNEVLTKIPVMPISYADAQPLLAAMKGPLAPVSWRGSLPITYHVGPGPTQVHFKLSFNWGMKSINDVITVIPGSQYPDQWLIHGNHHDAWVNGAGDPLTGASALLEEARAMSVLLKQGWKPKRTIVLCLWDGEEPGLLGSTEWGETHDAELRQKAAVYINTDSNSRGYFSAEGSHTLEQFINGVIRDIQDPETKLTVWRRLQARRAVPALNGEPNGAAEDRAEAVKRPDLRIGALGSGSDYTVFIDHLGVASLNVAYSGEDDTSGVYHSAYDSFYYYTHFSDTDFTYARTLTQTMGTAMMRLADAELLPYDFDNLTDTVQRYVGEVQRLARQRRDQIIESNRLIDDGSFAAVQDPKRKTALPQKQQVPAALDFTALDNGLAALKREAAAFAKAAEQAAANGGSAMARAQLREANSRLIAVERAMTSQEGLPGRPWFQHQIYAPGFYTGYGVKTLPGVREAIEQGQWTLAEQQIGKLGKVLENTGAAIGSAAAELSRAIQ